MLTQKFILATAGKYFELSPTERQDFFGGGEVDVDVCLLSEFFV